jgi:hypothetical protein
MADVNNNNTNNLNFVRVSNTVIFDNQIIWAQKLNKILFQCSERDKNFNFNFVKQAEIESILELFKNTTIGTNDTNQYSFKKELDSCWYHLSECTSKLAYLNSISLYFKEIYNLSKKKPIEEFYILTENLFREGEKMYDSFIYSIDDLLEAHEMPCSNLIRLEHYIDSCYLFDIMLESAFKIYNDIQHTFQLLTSICDQYQNVIDLIFNNGKLFEFYNQLKESLDQSEINTIPLFKNENFSLYKTDNNRKFIFSILKHLESFICLLLNYKKSFIIGLRNLKVTNYVYEATSNYFGRVVGLESFKTEMICNVITRQTKSCKFETFENIYLPVALQYCHGYLAKRVDQLHDLQLLPEDRNLIKTLLNAFENRNFSK